ncbi:MAG: hypothetical protein KDA42_18890 [Planctomycetales bacterium]|nr:hypothetical protein [Planctomycetales bacterium]
MRASTISKLLWLGSGFVLGFLYSVLHATWNLWPFQDNAIFHWLRWSGKEAIKWGFTGVVMAITLFVSMQLLNAAIAAWELYQQQGGHGKRHHRH